ncbi:hypothetical protein HK102_013047 [Quaeritorhiza haematococci]|nr:hypothetical protein HK102_013047 [Quaeritorhiza haematococci]
MSSSLPSKSRARPEQSRYVPPHERRRAAAAATTATTTSAPSTPERRGNAQQDPHGGRSATTSTTTPVASPERRPQGQQHLDERKPSGELARPQSRQSPEKVQHRGSSPTKKNEASGDAVGGLAEKVEALSVKEDSQTGEMSGVTGGDAVDEWETILNEEEDAPPVPDVRTIERRRPQLLSDDHLDSNESTTILDVFGFPISFKTHDLQQIFQEYESQGGFRIKWLEDDRALIIFKQASTAKLAYLNTLDHPLVKVTPFRGKLPDKQNEGPAVPRPVTTDLVARRLISGALGLRTPKKGSAAEEKEKSKLEEAKAKKAAEKAALKKREEELNNAWDE